jgi:fructose-specific component phosphotransferase system IIB-like protein
MKLPSSVSKVLTNKYVLYFVLFLAVTNVLGYMIMGQFTATLFFIIIAYLISNFSQNMIIILGSSLLLTNVLMVGNTVKEGMVNADSTAINTPNNSVSNAVTNTANDNKKQPATQSVGTTTLITPPVDPSLMNSSVSTEENTMNTEAGADVEPTSTTKDEAMNVMSNKKRNRIDYATTLEEAYGDLNNILGSEGIKKLTDDTQRLMSQQLQLADAMKSMTPLMENAKSMLQGFDLKNLDGLADLAKSFNPSK